VGVTTPHEESDSGGEPVGQDASLAVHIISVSAAMVGVCLTVIGLFQVVQGLHGLNTPADNILALDAVVFLFACLLAYASLRSRAPGRRRQLERIADGCFLCALVIMTVMAGAIAFELW
jgi:hypothetical protein